MLACAAAGAAAACRWCYYWRKETSSAVSVIMHPLWHWLIACSLQKLWYHTYFKGSLGTSLSGLPYHCDAPQNKSLPLSASATFDAHLSPSISYIEHNIIIFEIAHITLCDEKKLGHHGTPLRFVDNNILPRRPITSGRIRH